MRSWDVLLLAAGSMPCCHCVDEQSVCRAWGTVLLPHCCRARRKFQRGLKRKPMTLIKKLRKAKKECEEGEKPNTVRTHLRNMTIVPEMIGSIVGVYNGKTFNQVSLPAAALWDTGERRLGMWGTAVPWK